MAVAQNLVLPAQAYDDCDQLENAFYILELQQGFDQSDDELNQVDIIFLTFQAAQALGKLVQQSEHKEELLSHLSVIKVH